MMTAEDLYEERHCVHGTLDPDGDPGCLLCGEERDNYASHQASEQAGEETRCFFCDTRASRWHREPCPEHPHRKRW